MVSCAKNARVVEKEPGILPVKDTATFPRAVIETERIANFTQGIKYGQVCFVDPFEENSPVTSV